MLKKEFEFAISATLCLFVTSPLPALNKKRVQMTNSNNVFKTRNARILTSANMPFLNKQTNSIKKYNM